MRYSVASLTLLAGLGAGICLAQTPKVAVTSDGTQTSVQITQPSTLRLVLEEFCRTTKSRCNWDSRAEQSLNAETVPPMVLKGTWAATVAKLMEGTELDYASFSPLAAQAGRLWIEYRSPSVSAETRAPSPGGPRRENFLREASTAPASRIARTPNDPGDRNNPNIPRAGGRGPGSPGFQPTVASVPAPITNPADPKSVVFMDRPVTPEVNGPGSPFADENGKPVPAVVSPEPGSPFPGIQPKPEPQDPSGRPASPFPPGQ